jgi:hypothetical protein
VSVGALTPCACQNRASRAPPPKVSQYGRLLRSQSLLHPMGHFDLSCVTARPPARPPASHNVHRSALQVWLLTTVRNGLHSAALVRRGLSDAAQHSPLFAHLVLPLMRSPRHVAEFILESLIDPDKRACRRGWSAPV